MNVWGAAAWLIVPTLVSAPPAASPPDKGIKPVPAVSPVPGDRRVALVIGNARYTHIPTLNNPTSDTRRIARSLRQVGFEVEEAHDLDRDGRLRTIRRFGERLADADVAFFYFSGHGLQQEGRVYLVPTSARIRIESDIELEAVDVGRVLARLEDGGAQRTNLVFLDACRNNPIPRQSRRPVTGLASIDAPVGSLIAYATAPGRTASDGVGDNSPFALALAEEMLVPGLPIETVMKRVRVRVQQASGGEQIPWQSSSLTGEFFFVPSSAQGGSVAAPTDAPAPATEGDDGWWRGDDGEATPSSQDTVVEVDGAGGNAWMVAGIWTAVIAGIASPTLGVTAVASVLYTLPFTGSAAEISESLRWTPMLIPAAFGVASIVAFFVAVGGAGVAGGLYLLDEEGPADEGKAELD